MAHVDSGELPDFLELDEPSLASENDKELMTMMKTARLELEVRALRAELAAREARDVQAARDAAAMEKAKLFTDAQMFEMFKDLAARQSITLEICDGYVENVEAFCEKARRVDPTERNVCWIAFLLDGYRPSAGKLVTFTARFILDGTCVSREIRGVVDSRSCNTRGTMFFKIEKDGNVCEVIDVVFAPDNWRNARGKKGSAGALAAVQEELHVEDEREYELDGFFDLAGLDFNELEVPDDDFLDGDPFMSSQNAGQKRGISSEEHKDAQSVHDMDEAAHHKSARRKDVAMFLSKWRGLGSFRPGQKVAILWYAGRLWVSTRRSSRCRFICWAVVANLHGLCGHPAPLAVADPDGLGPVEGIAVVVVGYVMLHMSDPTIDIHRPSMMCTVEGETLCTIVQPEQHENGYVLVKVQSLFDAIVAGTMVPDRYLYAMTRERHVLIELGYEAASHGLSDLVVQFANMLADTDIDIEDYVAILSEWALLALYEDRLDTAGRLFAMGADGDLYADYELEMLRDDSRILDLFQFHRFDGIFAQ